MGAFWACGYLCPHRASPPAGPAPGLHQGVCWSKGCFLEHCLPCGSKARVLRAMSSFLSYPPPPPPSPGQQPTAHPDTGLATPSSPSVLGTSPVRAWPARPRGKQAGARGQPLKARAAPRTLRAPAEAQAAPKSSRDEKGCPDLSGTGEGGVSTKGPASRGRGAVQPLCLGSRQNPECP